MSKFISTTCADPPASGSSILAALPRDTTCKTLRQRSVKLRNEVTKSRSAGTAKRQDLSLSPSVSQSLRSSMTPRFPEHDIPHRFPEIPEIRTEGMFIIFIEVFYFRSLDAFQVIGHVCIKRRD